MGAVSDIAVTYTPDQFTKPRYTSVADLRLEERGIKYVRVQHLDYGNVVRFRVVPVGYFKRICKNARPGLNFTPLALAFVGIQFAGGFAPARMADCLQAIDLSSFRVCTYAPGHAVVMTWFQEKVPSLNGELAIPLCPRTILQNVTDKAREKAGLSFLVGFESEFLLLKKSWPPELVNEAGWGASAGYMTGAIESSVLDEIVDCVEEAGIEVHFIHAEAIPGQYELVTGPMSPLDAADALVFTRETIYNVANKHGLRATFAPQLFSNIGSGAHMHLSLYSSAPAASPDTRSDAGLAPKLTPTERSFLQTLVEHLPSLSAITLPTPASYKRVEDGIFSGGTYACWGWHNKDAPVRLCGENNPNQFEVKTIDGTSNPYLVSAGILAAGLEGVLSGAELKTGNCTKPAAQMSEDEKKAVGLENPRRYPRTVSDARQMLDKDQYLKEALGTEFVDTYLKVNKLLEEYMTQPTEEATVKRLIETF
ncbi:glutamine synthetase/guanido kinase [Daedalea quercina L-15889]|uniref:Glutamine synthetase/guanido kinase n=1 Tax=Daedalea quercina L-15889 TaxID=1314783 RepID=A0A165LF66_9APHY|nr:glutamine synthetase/guanido kinase [Daedalea quercina L-15889]